MDVDVLYITEVKDFYFLFFLNNNNKTSNKRLHILSIGTVPEAEMYSESFTLPVFTTKIHPGLEIPWAGLTLGW